MLTRRTTIYLIKFWGMRSSILEKKIDKLVGTFTHSREKWLVNLPLGRSMYSILDFLSKNDVYKKRVPLVVLLQ